MTFKTKTAEKPMINLIMIGDVDYGKSTLAGRIYSELGFISKEEMARLERHAKQLGRPDAKYAYVLSKTLQERQRGITIELGYKGFETESRRINMIDAPGHVEFMRNMITGAANADAAALMVDVTQAMSGKISAQTKEHLAIALVFGLKQLVVLVNKMDLVNYSQKVYGDAKAFLIATLKGMGFESVENYDYVPISALLGENVLRRSQNMTWYKGKTFAEVVNEFHEPERILDAPLRMPVLRAYSLPDVGIVVAGKIQSGTVTVGNRILICPQIGNTKIAAEVGSIEWQHRKVDAGRHGMDVGMGLKNLSNSFAKRLIKKGYVVTNEEQPLSAIKNFKAEITILDYPTEIRENYAPLLHCHQARLPCKLIKLESKLDAKTRRVIEKNPRSLKKGDVAVVTIEPQKPFVAETEKAVPHMGRFALRDSNLTVAGGRILEINT